MNRRISAFFISIVVLLVLVTSVAAAPDAPGTPTLRWVTTSATTAELRADGIENGGGLPNNGAISWDIYFRFPDTVAAPYPTITAVPGPSWTGLNCGFASPIAPNQPSGPGATGDRGVFINGSCTSSFPASSVTGDNVLLATLTFSGCPAAPGGFIMDLDSGDDVYGTSVATMFDRSNSEYYFQDSDLTDGGPMCTSPTAVTMAGFDATTDNPAPFAGAAWPLLAGAAAVAAGGAYALLRRKS